MRRRCNDPHRQVAEIDRRRLPCVSRPNVIAICNRFVVFWLSLTGNLAAAGADCQLAPRLAIIHQCAGPLVHEQNLPLPVKTAARCIVGYYQNLEASCSGLAAAAQWLLARLQNAASDGLDRGPPKQTARGTRCRQINGHKRSPSLGWCFFRQPFSNMLQHQGRSFPAAKS